MPWQAQKEFDFNVTFGAAGYGLAVGTTASLAPLVATSEPGQLGEFDLDVAFTNGAQAGFADGTRPVLHSPGEEPREADDFDLDVRLAGTPMQMQPPPQIPTFGGNTCHGTCFGQTCQGPLCGGVTGPNDCPNQTRQDLTCNTCHG